MSCRCSCINQYGTFDGACNDGYEGDGVGCVDIDECLASPCHGDGNCSNNAGSYTSACNDGFNGDGKACTDINVTPMPPVPTATAPTATHVMMITAVMV